MEKDKINNPDKSSKEKNREAHIFVKDKDPWINLTETKNCFEVMYDREKVWPEQSLKRLEEKNNQ